MILDRVDSEEHLAADLVVARRRGVLLARLERPAQRDQDLALGLGKTVHQRGEAAGPGHRCRALLRGAVFDDGFAEANRIAVSQPPSLRDPRPVDERAVARQAIVGDRPVLADERELRVRS